MLRLYYVGDYTRNVSGLKGQNIGLVFLTEHPLKSSPKWQNVSLSHKRGNYTCSNQLTNLEIIFGKFLGSFAIWGNDATLARLPHGRQPPTHFQFKKSHDRYLGYVVLPCKFSDKVESFAHRDQQTNMYRICCSKPQRWPLSSFGLWTSSTINWLRACSHIWTNPKITNFFESKTIQLVDYSKLEYEQEEYLKWSRNHQIGFNGIIANCSCLDHDSVGL